MNCINCGLELPTGDSPNSVVCRNCESGITGVTYCSSPNVCEHGSLKRSCEICERDAEIAELRRDNSSMRRHMTEMSQREVKLRREVAAERKLREGANEVAESAERELAEARERLGAVESSPIVHACVYGDGWEHDKSSEVEWFDDDLLQELCEGWHWERFRLVPIRDAQPAQPSEGGKQGGRDE